MPDQRKARARPPEDSRTREWLQLLAAIVGLVSAVAGGVFGVLANQAKADAQAATTTTQKRADDAQTRIADLTRELTAARTANDDLRHRLAAPGDVAPAETFRHGTVVLSRGRRLDLDAAQSDPQWGILADHEWAVDLGWEYGCDGICFGDGSSDFLNRDDRVIVDDEPNQQVCSTTTGYATGDIPVAVVRAGLTFCVITDQQRTAAVRVVETAGSAAPLELEVTTFAKPGD
jgi:hypothetical protein